MFEVIAWDMYDGEKKKSLGIYESLEISGNTVRDPDGNIILFYGTTFTWIDRDGIGWYDFTIGVPE